MAMPDYIKTQFDHLIMAAKNNHLAILECTDKETGAVRYVLAAIVRTNGEEAACVPFGHMSEDTSEYVPPEEATRVRAPAQALRPAKPVTKDKILAGKFGLSGFEKPTIIKPD
jgi:Family of unknown function (DUF6117)